MIGDRELQDAIRECENAPTNYQNCEKLATFYAIYDHRHRAPAVQTLTETIVDHYNDSAFGEAIAGKSAEEMWAIIGELMEALQVVNPKLYDSVMRKIRG